MSGAYVLGVDAGLSTIQTVAYDLDGAVLASASEPTPEHRPKPGWREVDPDALWAATVRSIASVTDQLHGPAIGVGVAGHGHGLYALDADGTPVRPAIKSTDDRAADLLASWDADGTAATVAAALGYEPFGADPVSLLAWLATHEPDALERIDHVLFCKDYLKYRLTNVVSTDEMEGSALDLPTGTGAEQALGALGLAKFVGRLPPVVPSWEACGSITPAAADTTGIPAGTPVASGLHDVGATALGCGAFQPGDATFIVGTWGQSVTVWADRPDGPGLARRFRPNTWIQYRGNRSATASLDWFLDALCEPLTAMAESRDVDRYTLVDDIVDGVTPGAEGVLFVPYLDGSTDDPTDRGAFLGLSIEHDRAAMLRAVFEGVAYAQIIRMDQLRERTTLRRCYIAGGGANSPVWCQLFADVIGRRISVATGQAAGARGAAICAAIAAGRYSTHADAVASMVTHEREHVPDPDRVADYRSRLETFSAAAAAIRPTTRALRQEAND